MTVRGADYPRRKNDNYPTPPEVAKVLFDRIWFASTVYDPAAGAGHNILKVAKTKGYRPMSSDIIKGQDFVTRSRPLPDRTDIVTNPPYGDRRGSLSLAFIEKSLELTKAHKGKVAMLLPVDFDSGKTRQHVFGGHQAFAEKIILLDRIKWFKGKSGSTNHAWFIWNWKNTDVPTIKYARIEQ